MYTSVCMSIHSDICSCTHPYTHIRLYIYPDTSIIIHIFKICTSTCTQKWFVLLRKSATGQGRHPLAHIGTERILLIRYIQYIGPHQDTSEPRIAQQPPSSMRMPFLHAYFAICTFSVFAYLLRHKRTFLHVLLPIVLS